MSTSSGQQQQQKVIPQNVAIANANANTNDELAYYETRRGQGWEDPNNMKILTEWIHYAAVYLDILSEATEGYRKTLRFNTIINLIVSTLASTISVSTFNTSEQSNPQMALALKIVFTTLTFMLTIAAGYIKVYQIQEKLENSLRLKQEWALFGSKISSEMQLPLVLRKNAIFLISTMKGTYLDLVKSDMGIKKDIIRRMAVRSGLKEDDLTLSELFERIIKYEVFRLTDESDGSDQHNDRKLTELAISYGLPTPMVRRNSRSLAHIEDDIKPSQIPDGVAIKVSAPRYDEIALKKFMAAVGQPACNEIEAQQEELDKIARALKESEMIKAAAAAAAASTKNEIVQGVKGFFNKLTPGSSEEKSQKETNAKQILADRGRVSSFLRSPASRTTNHRPSILVPYKAPSSGQELEQQRRCPKCGIPSIERICSNCADHSSDSSGDQRRSSIVSHESNDSHESALSHESPTDNF